MNDYVNVVWSEGAYVCPQHFQQNDRYFKNELQKIIKYNQPFYYGVIDLTINTSLLAEGVFSLTTLKIVFEDGTVYTPSDDEIEMLNLYVPENIESAKLYLSLSRLSVNNKEVIFDDELKANTRYIAYDKSIVDTSDEQRNSRFINLARLNVRLLFKHELSANSTNIPIAIITTNSNAEIEIDDSYIAPTLIAQNNRVLKNYIHEIYGLLLQRTENLSNAVNDPNRGGALEVSDFIMLQTVNRSLAYMQHINEGTPHTHPEALFVEMSKLCADLMTFLPGRKMIDMPTYNHKDLKTCFMQLISKLRLSLSTVLEQRIIRIELVNKDKGLYIGLTPNQVIIDTAKFVLAVKADLPEEEIRRKIPSIAKISTVEKIKELVSYHLPGIKLIPLSVVPRELPYHSGHVYFELDKQTETWSLLNNSAGMAFYIAGNFPNLQLELWAIKAGA